MFRARVRVWGSDTECTVIKHIEVYVDKGRVRIMVLSSSTTTAAVVVKCRHKKIIGVHRIKVF